jgi:hypothetical protein
LFNGLLRVFVYVYDNAADVGQQIVHGHKMYVQTVFMLFFLTNREGGTQY